MEINRIAIVAETDDGIVRNVYTQIGTREAILSLINVLEGEVKLSKEPAENVLIKNGKELDDS